MLKGFCFLTTGILFFVPTSWATYSIAACDTASHVCGVAVQTNNLAVGASVPYAKAGIGAIASQFETNPNYGPRGLALLAQGKSPEETLHQLLADDGHFDGQGIESRQVGIVSADGRVFVYTGKEAAHANWAGSRTGNGYSIQGNGLVGPQVVAAMEQAFLKTTGALAERLMAALIAGDRAGGQSTGRESAALLVSTPDGFPLDIDLRVDHSADPVSDLQTLLNIQMARQQIIQASIAANQARFADARAQLIAGVARAPMWARTWTSAARVAARIEEPELTLQYLNIAFGMNLKWTETEIGSGNFAALGADPLFHRWVNNEQQNSVLADYRQFSLKKNPPPLETIDIAANLLEIGNPAESLVALERVTASQSTAETFLLRATAYAALGQYSQALNACSSGLASSPADHRLRLRCARFKTESEKQSSN